MCLRSFAAYIARIVVFLPFLTFSSYVPKQEIFDEVSEEQLLPSWSYELRTVLDTLAVLLAQGAEVGLLEEKITEVRMEDAVVFPFVNPRG